MTTKATYCGQPPDLGRKVIGKQHPNEGYAVLRCGGTEVVLSYTLLHHLELRIDSECPVFGDLCKLQRAIHSITCEASLGRTG